MNLEQPLISVSSVSKSFLIGTQMVNVLKDINIQIMPQDFTVIFGPSGCGKSTLLHSILGLEIPTSGTINLFGKSIYLKTSEDDRSIVRKSHIGMVYQQPNWIKSLTVLENVAFPLMLTGEKNIDIRTQKAKEMLELVNMEGWANYSPSELSSGQQQLVALSRALINNPEIIVADEPTGNLDYETGQKLMQILSALNKEHKKTILMVTHDLEYLNYATVGIQMIDGRITDIYKGKNSQEMLDKIKCKRTVPKSNE